MINWINVSRRFSEMKNVTFTLKCNGDRFKVHNTDFYSAFFDAFTSRGSIDKVQIEFELDGKTYTVFPDVMSAKSVVQAVTDLFPTNIFNYDCRATVLVMTTRAGVYADFLQVFRERGKNSRLVKTSYTVGDIINSKSTMGLVSLLPHILKNSAKWGKYIFEQGEVYVSPDVNLPFLYRMFLTGNEFDKALASMSSVVFARNNELLPSDATSLIALCGDSFKLELEFALGGRSK